MRRSVLCFKRAFADLRGTCARKNAISTILTTLHIGRLRQVRRENTSCKDHQPPVQPTNQDWRSTRKLGFDCQSVLGTRTRTCTCPVCKAARGHIFTARSAVQYRRARSWKRRKQGRGQTTAAAASAPSTCLA